MKDRNKETATGFIDYNWPHKPKETLVVFGDKGFDLEDIQDQPIIIGVVWTEIFYQGEWYKEETRLIDVEWFRNQLVTREIAFRDKR